MGKIARKLMCSYGDKTDCANRVSSRVKNVPVLNKRMHLKVGKIRIVDADGVVREDAFYNYVTAWYNVDQMTYYVTQANFYPPPPPFDFETQEHGNLMLKRALKR